MFTSVFDMFKVGIGPSSSHTMGPMIAARRFAEEHGANPNAHAVVVRLFGSLAFTGKGHRTDRAICLGLCGVRPEAADPDILDGALAEVVARRSVTLASGRVLAFHPEKSIVFDYSRSLPAHPNGMIFELHDDEGAALVAQTHYSIGGGFVVSDAELRSRDSSGRELVSVPYPHESARQILDAGHRTGLRIATMAAANEVAAHPSRDLSAGLDGLWQVMNASIERGLSRGGELPGGLRVKRRASDIMKKIEVERRDGRGNQISPSDFLPVYAMAVNEENANGGRIVTAPTNGAAGVIPAVLRYHSEVDIHAGVETRKAFLLTAATIGSIIKRNASISGAEMGCQGEVGSAAAMAAAGLCAVRGGSNEQIENAAEIALEHHLGMTCDPVQGLVQIPCIERNGIAAVKALTAASLALRGDGTHRVPLDNCIEAMRQTGLDMSSKYRETSLGGLSVNLPEC